MEARRARPPGGAEPNAPASATRSPPRTAPDRTWEPWVTVAAVGVFLLVAVLWLLAARADPGLLERDWVAFDRAATRVQHGSWEDVYRLSLDERLPFLYPPYAIWLTLPLALVGPFPSYLLVLGAAVGSLVGAGVVLDRVEPGRRRAVAVVTASGLMSGPFLLVLITGQNSACYVAAVLVGMWLRLKGRDRLGGFCWAFLLVKPNIAAFFLLFLLVRRQRRSLEGFGLGAVVAMAGTVPMGLGVWRGFTDGLVAVDTMLGDLGNWYGQPTVLSSLEVGLGPVGLGGLGRAIWLAGATLGVALLARRWSERTPASVEPGTDRRQELRLVGSVCLLAVAANPRLYAYDAMLLMVPAAAWYLYRGCYRPRARHAVGVCIAAIDGIMLSTWAGWPSAFLAAPFIAAWLGIELSEQRCGLPAATSKPSAAEPTCAEAA